MRVAAFNNSRHSLAEANDINPRTKQLMEDSFNEQAFIDLQSEYQETFAQMALIRAKSKNNFMKILTEEQREKMKSHKRFGGKRSHFAQ